MEAKLNHYVGVELNDAEIRVAALTLRGDKLSETRVATMPTPPGSFGRGLVIKPDAVADAVLRLCQSIEVPSTAKVVFSVGAEHMAVRILPVPPVPDDELPIIVAGEVDHFGLLKSAGSNYAYFRYVVPPRAGESPITNVAIMGIEEHVNRPLLEVAAKLGMQVEAVEPAPLAALRCALVSLGGRGGAIVVVMTATSTEIVPLAHGTLIGYRRLESGVRPNQVAPTADMSPEAMPTELQNFAVELRRTVEFYRREYPSLPTTERVVLCVDNDAMAALGPMITASVGVETVVLSPTEAGWHTEGASPRMSTAAGLAMHALPSTHGLPKLDFFARQRVQSMQTAVKRNFAGAIAVSALALVLGGAMYYLFQKQVDNRMLEVQQTQTRADTIKNDVASVLGERHLKQTQMQALKMDGVPLPAIIDYIVAAVGPNVGLSSVTATPDLKVVIQGEAANEASMLTMVTNLQNCPVLRDVRVTSFARPNPPVGDVVTFQLTGTTVTLNRIKTQPRYKEVK